MICTDSSMRRQAQVRALMMPMVGHGDDSWHLITIVNNVSGCGVCQEWCIYKMGCSARGGSWVDVLASCMVNAAVCTY